jgi:predicted PurR-regulated permease PerM
MSASSDPGTEAVQTQRTLELTIRVGAVFLLAAWCIQIVLPFLGAVVWGIVIAVAANAPYQRLEAALGGRSKPAAALFALLALLLLIVPAVLLTDSLASGARQLAEVLRDGSLEIPPPPAEVRSWPLIGGPTYEFWELASKSLETALAPLAPQLKTFSVHMLAAAASAGFGILQFVLSVIIAAALLATSAVGDRTADAIAARLAGDRGPELADLAGATMRGVTRGIIGVAMIQAILAGFGFIAVGLPGAGLWALLCLVFAVVQLPVALFMTPIVIYVFTSASTLVAVFFLAWAIFVSLIDNVLKPLLFSRGARVPTLVIFVGSIGGMLSMGILGLFVGAVVLSVGYEVTRMWLYGDVGEDSSVPAQAT